MRAVDLAAYLRPMLREVSNAGYARRLTLLGFRYWFVQGTTPLTSTWGSARQRAIVAAQDVQPTALVAIDRRRYWAFEGRFWWEDDGLDAGDVLALVRQRERRRRRRLDDAHAALGRDAAPSRRRERVARELRRAVWERDGGACVECGSAFDLQYDHIIPVARGGATTFQNLELLCAPCNRRKSDAIA